MKSFCAKKLKKNAGGEKKAISLKWPQKFLNFVTH